MDQVDAFPEHISTTVVPVTLPENPDALVYAALQGHVRACILYQEPNTKRVFVLFCKDNWHQKKTLVDNFKRAILESKHVNEFRPDDVLWEKISKGLLRNPDRFLKNTDKRMVYIYNNMFFVKKDFTFGFRTVKSGEIHLIQTTHVPMLIYEFPSSSLRCRANPNLFRRSFEPFDQMLYHRMVLEPQTTYPIPAGTRYILLTIQKTVQRKRFDQKAYVTSPPTPCPKTLRQKYLGTARYFPKKKRAHLPPIIRPSMPHVMIIKPSTALATLNPYTQSDNLRSFTSRSAHPSGRQFLKFLLPDPPKQIPLLRSFYQIHQWSRRLEPTYGCDYSMDQILPSVFGDYLQ
ncbi:uncharacterized protein TNCV_1239961 [Trichonephila clavipes]|nr:uncharacterized protein TNCV_1239961 [Trichonephila clavipes]